ncbi:hypothetical protein JCM3766R1_003222 [Sporobolomyces carnicolor]
MLRDLISFLPPELLSTIFDLAYDDSQAPCAPINRALLPFQRRVLFRHVRISSHLGLEQFVASIESNTAFGGMVTSLRAEDVDGPGGATTNKRRLKALVSALVNLERLEIGWCCSTFIELVLSPRVARSSLPRLCSLDIDFNLEYLYLGAKTFKQDVVDTLLRLPKLKAVGFGPDAFLPASRLEELAINPGRLTSLRKIILDQFEGKEGWKIDEDSDGVTLHPSHAFSAFHVGPGWILPVWTSVPEQEWRKLVNRIRAQGIRVEGTILKAFGVESAFETETMTCMVAYAFEKGNFDDCRDMYGNDFVDELLKELVGE